MSVFAYADETIFTIDQNVDTIALGSGILVGSKEITNEVTEMAISNLSSDQDFDGKKDKRTIERNYFHASEDSKNAHSHFCNAINEHIKGVFDFTYYDNVNEKDLSKTTHTEGIFTRCLTGSSVEFFNYPDEVFLIIEKRNNLNKDVIEKWKQSVYRLLEGITLDIPSYKVYFPKINIVLAGKDHPGLQVVDFLLWAINRSKKIPPNEIWSKRLAIKAFHYYEDKGGRNRGQYRINSYPDTDLKVNYDLPFEKAETWEEVNEAFILIERFLRTIDKTDFSEINIYLWEDSNNLRELLKDETKHLTVADIENIGRLFIRLFDTLPLYSNLKSDKEWKAMFHAKYLAAMLSRNGQIHLQRTKGQLLQWRFKMQTEYPVDLLNMMK
jgi:hypothetical protein